MPVKKKVPARVQYKDYADYLSSPKWKQVKEDYKKNEQTESCLCCGCDIEGCNRVANFHHFKYPKDWNNDSWENLLIVCSNCHNGLHAMNDHNSEPISIRDYILSLSYCSSDRLMTELEVLNTDQLWADCQGRFEITQKGLTSRKSMEINATINDQYMISMFEGMRDNYIKGESNE
jgi:hypothetical protein